MSGTQASMMGYLTTANERSVSTCPALATPEGMTEKSAVIASH